MIYQIKDLLAPAYQKILDRNGRGKDLSITSLPELDNKIWGFSKQKLVLVAGRPSNGKSACMVQLAMDFAKRGKKILFFSLEMTKQTMIERIIANECRIDNTLLLTGQIIHDKDEQKKVEALRDIIKNINFVVSDTIGKTFAEIFKIIEEMDTDIDAVFIDYIQMIKNIGMNKKEAIDDYIKKLRELAIRRNFCAVVASQINRGTHQTAKITPPNLWELKGSGDLEEHCDMAILLHFPGHYDEMEGKRYLMNVAKNRDGRTGEMECTFEAKHGRIREGYVHTENNTDQKPTTRDFY